MKPNSKLRYRVACLLGICGFVLGSITVAQANITVTSLNDSGLGSLRQAIADAAPGDTIDFAVTGTITLTSGELAITNDLTIAGPGRTNLTVSGNNASRIFNINAPDATVAISSVTIANGVSAHDDAGGIKNVGNLTVSNCNISNCTAWGVHGGGIRNGSYYEFPFVPSKLTVLNSSFSGNYAQQGGAISCFPAAQLIVVNSTFTSNSADAAGAIEVWDYGNVAVTNSTFSGNSASSGGALYNASYSSLVVSSCTISSNTAGQYGGGGIKNYSSGACTIINSIVAGNSASSGPDCQGEIISSDYNLIGNTNGATITGVTTHNIYSKNPLLGPLADNGGPTMTHALLPGSPAIDQGSSGGLATDQRGQPRPFNFPAYFDAADSSDIGAYELQERAQTGPVFTVNTTDDADDAVPGIAHCSLREAINAANANADTNTIDFAAEITGLHTGVTGTITLTNGQLTVTNSANIAGPGAANLTVSGNNASRIFRITGATVSISDLKVADGQVTVPNSSGWGAGIRVDYYSAVTISNCVVTGNQQLNDDGGGIANDHSVLTLFNSVVSGNRASTSGSGGGIYNFFGEVIIIGSTICSNVAYYGGGIDNNSYSAAKLTNCTISANTALDAAGGIDGSAFMESCTITRNYAVSFGGGICCGGQMRNCVVAGNSAGGGTSPDCGGTINSLDYNLIQNTNGCTITNLTAHNIYNQDPKLGPLADPGGPTPTHALRFDSPAIDAGNSGGLTTDQRGLPRPIDDPNTPNAGGGDGSDIGAYEADPNLRILAIEKLGSDIRLRFNTVLGKSYGVDSENNLDSSWSWLTNNIAGTGSSIQAVDAGGANQPRRFYRAVLLP